MDTWVNINLLLSGKTVSSISSKKNMKITQAKKLTKINTKSKNVTLFSFYRGDAKSYSRLKNKHKYQQRSQKTMSLLKNRSDRWKQLFSHRLREVIIFH